MNRKSQKSAAARTEVGQKKIIAPLSQNGIDRVIIEQRIKEGHYHRPQVLLAIARRLAAEWFR